MLSYCSFLSSLCVVMSFCLCVLLVPLKVNSESQVDISMCRGINLYLHVDPTEEDIKKLSRWGVNVIRLFLHTSETRRRYIKLYDEGGVNFNAKKIEQIDRVVRLAGRFDINVILATATFPGFDKEIWSDYSCWDKHIKLWTDIASRYKNTTNVIGFHPIDEPHLVKVHGTDYDKFLMRAGKWQFPDSWRGTPKDYFELVRRLGRAINEITPNKFIVISGVGIWGFADNYRWMEPINGINAVYSFNPYIPPPFANSGKINKRTGKTKKITTYSSDKDLEKLYSAMQPVVHFAKANNASIFVSGFGIPYTTEKKGAYEWMKDMLSFFDKHGWGWAYFSYGIPFRSPEVLGPGEKRGQWHRSENTERLKVLKEHWKASL